MLIELYPRLKNGSPCVLFKNFLNTEDYDYKSLTIKFNAHYKRIGYLAMNQIKDASRDIWMCDLDFYIKG